MRHRLPFIAMGVAGILAMSAGSALATIPGTLDSVQTTTDHNLVPQSLLAQTFVPTMSGTLSAVQVFTTIYNPPAVAEPAAPPSVTVQITGTASNLPTPTILDAVTFTPANNDWNTILFSPGIHVAAGTKYAILLNVGVSGTAEWNGACADPYGPGAALISNAGSWETIPTFDDGSCITDFAFRTYILAPAASPSPTAPPTSTIGSTGESRSDPSGLLVFAGLALAASAAVLVSISRRRLTQQ